MKREKNNPISNHYLQLAETCLQRRFAEDAGEISKEEMAARSVVTCMEYGGFPHQTVGSGFEIAFYAFLQQSENASCLSMRLPIELPLHKWLELIQASIRHKKSVECIINNALIQTDYILGAAVGDPKIEVGDLESGHTDSRI